MAFVTPRMSLKVWNAGSDPYDHEQLADNLLKLDQHDHAQGRGTPIPGEGIQPGAITTTHIYPGAVGKEALADASIGTDQIVDEAVSNQKLSFNARIPLGTVLDWYCVDPQNYQAFLPDGWVVCAATPTGPLVLAAGEHDMPGVTGTFTVPDLVGRIVMGADPTKALNVTPDGTNSYKPGVLGQAGTNVPQSHAHGLASHTHTHTHTHTHPHTHTGTTTDDGSHSHVYRNTVSLDPGGTIYRIINPQDNDILPAGEFNSDYGALSFTSVAGTVNTNFSAGNNRIFKNSTENGGTHHHTFNSDGASNNTTDGPNNGVTSGPSTANSDPQTIDTRMAHTGLLKIMKVRNA